MGRRPYKNKHLPPRLRARPKGVKVFYYYDKGGKPRREIPLGSDYALAVKKWAEFEIDQRPKYPAIITFRYVAERYTRDVIPQKAFRTQQDNLAEVAKLYDFFDDPPVPLEQIQPINVRQYLDWRGTKAKTRANREKALLSHIWNKAREWGYTDKPNPCTGIKGHKETGREVYVEDQDYKKLWEAASAPLRDAMDLAYLTGQRPSDVLRMSETEIRDGVLVLTQAKTKKKLRIAVTGELAQVIARIRSRKRELKGVTSLSLVVSNKGSPVSLSWLQDMFAQARAAAGVDFQFRDLRAKAASDKADAQGIEKAQRQLGHGSVVMTHHYVRNRKEDKVDPTR